MGIGAPTIEYNEKVKGVKGKWENRKGKKLAGCYARATWRPPRLFLGIIWGEWYNEDSTMKIRNVCCDYISDR